MKFTFNNCPCKTRVDIWLAECMWLGWGGFYVSLAGWWAKVGGWTWKAKVGHSVPFPCCSFPSSTASSLMSPLGTLDLLPRRPFTWLTKVRKQTFFLSINNGPISPLRRYQALHWHSTLIQSVCRNTKGTLDSPYKNPFHTLNLQQC